MAAPKLLNYFYSVHYTHLHPFTRHIHLLSSDAPALSTDAETVALGLAGTAITDHAVIAPSIMTTAAGTAIGGDGIPSSGEWDDEALAASFSRKGTAAVVTGTGTTAELLDMKAFDAKRRGEDDIAERLRIEETKAQIAAAKEGMEREAQRLKEERESKEFKEVTKPSHSATSSTAGVAGSKWVPSRMRMGVGLDRVRIGSSLGMPSSKLDTQDENLFPDLAAADAILEQKKDQVAYKVAKKTAVGGGATWGSRPPAVQPKEVEPDAKAPEPDPEPEVEPVAVAAAASSPVVPPKKVAKKKKKDLSTFKVAS